LRTITKLQTEAALVRPVPKTAFMILATLALAACGLDEATDDARQRQAPSADAKDTRF